MAQLRSISVRKGCEPAPPARHLGKAPEAPLADAGASRSWTGPELAARLGVGVRTVRRDVERLRRSATPSMPTPGVGRRVPPRRRRRAAAPAARRGGGRRRRGRAPHRGERQRVRHRGDRAARAREARGGAAPPLRRRVSAVSSALVPYPSFGAPVDAGLLALLAAAIRDRERLRLRYRDHAGTSTRRSSSPIGSSHRAPLVSRRLGHGP